MKLVESVFAGNSRATVLVAAAAGILGLAVTDWIVQPNVSLGFLYIIPILLAAGFLTHWQIAALGIFCSLLRETFALPQPWDHGFLTRLAMVGGAFVGSGLFVKELARNRQLAIKHNQELAAQIRLRQEAEKQLRVLIDSNPAAILTVNGDGRILTANGAARQLLADDGLEGELVARYLPALAHVPHARETERCFQTTMECTGHTKTGNPFLAQVWFSTYLTESGPRLAAIVLDSSEHLRDREGVGLVSLMTSSRVLVVSMLHEIRNMSVAARVAHTNLERQPGMIENKDFQALGSLVQGLAALSSSELRLSSDESKTYFDLPEILNELRIVIEPTCSDSEVEVHWEVPRTMPMVRCDRHSLLQVFLNLAQNSLRAMGDSPRRELHVIARQERNGIAVRFCDTGHGVPVPERLFQPFQPDSEGTGLGLYVSRAIVRSFAGDLYYEPQPAGSCFVVQLAARKGEMEGS